jgi:chemotaxis protein methyltransferase CheR
MPTATQKPADLTEDQFDEISELVKALCGINLHHGKKELVRSRLAKRLRRLGIATFDEYMACVRSDTTGSELTTMLDALSTNLTHFFREPRHFQYLKEAPLPAIIHRNRHSRRIRIWSAGCSSGEEAYSIAIVLADQLSDLGTWDARILATDLCTEMLARAREGTYDAVRLRDTPQPLLVKYFRCVQTRPEPRYQVAERVRKLVHFARLNLMGPWPMRGPFDAIFCRNVMIYFDKPTQNALVERFWRILAPGGTLFIGHSESLTGVKHSFRYVQPTVYQKP